MGTIHGTYLETMFDRGQGNSEAQIAIGDSGGGLFEMLPGRVETGRDRGPGAQRACLLR